MDELINKVIYAFAQKYCNGEINNAPCKECATLSDTITNTIQNREELLLFKSSRLSFKGMVAYSRSLMDERLRDKVNPISLTNLRNFDPNNF